MGQYVQIYIHHLVGGAALEEVAAAPHLQSGASGAARPWALLPRPRPLPLLRGGLRGELLLLEESLLLLLLPVLAELLLGQSLPAVPGVLSVPVLPSWCFSNRMSTIIPCTSLTSHSFRHSASQAPLGNAWSMAPNTTKPSASSLPVLSHLAARPCVTSSSEACPLTLRNTTAPGGRAPTSSWSCCHKS